MFLPGQLVVNAAGFSRKPKPEHFQEAVNNGLNMFCFVLFLGNPKSYLDNWSFRSNEKNDDLTFGILLVVVAMKPMVVFFF